MYSRGDALMILHDLQLHWYSFFHQILLSREIFSVAHELGHQKLHLSEQGLTIIKDDDFNDRDEYEVEANYLIFITSNIFKNLINHLIPTKTLNIMKLFNRGEMDFQTNLSKRRSKIKTVPFAYLPMCTW